MTVKSWTEEAEEAAAAAMLNCANRVLAGRTSGEAARKAGARGTRGAAGVARRGWLYGSSAETGETTTALLRRRRREMNGAGREGIGGSEAGVLYSGKIVGVVWWVHEICFDLRSSRRP